MVLQFVIEHDQTCDKQVTPFLLSFVYMIMTIILGNNSGQEHDNNSGR